MSLLILFIGLGNLSRAFGSQGKAKCELVRNGQPVATIVLARHPQRAAAFAAMELQGHIQKITGALLPIRYADMKIRGSRILVGESPATQLLGLRSRDFKSQEYLVRFSPEALVLIGRDENDDNDATAADLTRPRRVPGKFGQALRFNGRNSFLCAPPDGFSDEEGSMEAWVWMPAAIQRIGTILRLHTTHEWSWHAIQREGNRIVYEAGINAKENTGGVTFLERVVSTELKEGWHHILATHSASERKMELFVDVQNQGTVKYLPTSCAKATVQIGAHVNGDGSAYDAFSGLIDEVRLSDVVRKPDTFAVIKPPVKDSHDRLLLHFDEADGGADDALLAPPGPFEERGTLNATYYFLQRYCGVHWYAPGDIGAVYRTTRTLTMTGDEVRRLPDMAYRWLVECPLRMPTGTDVVPARDMAFWTLRMNLGGQRFSAGHAFNGYYDRFLNIHSDWFAQGYKKRPPQMCYTNPDYIRQVVQDARDYFDGKGLKPGSHAMGNQFALVPMDNNEWCKCPRCQAELNAKEKDNPQWFSNGYASDYIWEFVNTVACRIKKSHPDKYLVGLAYYDYSYYPTKISLAPNVIVQICQSTRNWWQPSMKENDLKVFRDWTGKKTRPLYLWLYYLSPAGSAKQGNWSCFPGFYAHTIVQQMKMFHQAGIKGFMIEHTSEFDESYLFDQLELYVTLRLADDPALDGNGLIEEFFNGYYGAAAKPMRAFYEEVENAFSNPTNYPMEVQKSAKPVWQTQEIAWGSLGTAARMEKLGGLMSDAKHTARTEMEKQRVDFFSRGIWNYMTTGRKKYESQTKTR